LTVVFVANFTFGSFVFCMSIGAVAQISWGPNLA
jgi:hypothetical protein